MNYKVMVMVLFFNRYPLITASIVVLYSKMASCI